MTEAPSLAEELVRTGARDTGRGMPWKARTHCNHGHEFTPGNTLWRTDSSHGARRCRRCHRERTLAWYYRAGGNPGREARRAARRGQA